MIDMCWVLRWEQWGNKGTNKKEQARPVGKWWLVSSLSHTYAHSCAWCVMYLVYPLLYALDTGADWWDGAPRRNFTAGKNAYNLTAASTSSAALTACRAATRSIHAVMLGRFESSMFMNWHQRQATNR